MTNKKKIYMIVYSGIIAALYVVLTYPMAQFAFGPIQFRLAEVMTILPAYGFAYVPGISLGCFLANLLNPSNLGPVDIIGGTLATVLAGIFSALIGKKNKNLAIIPPILFNGIIVGGYLPFLLVDESSEVTVQAVLISMLEVAASEAVLLVVLGLPLILLIKKSRRLKEMIDKVK